MSWLYTTVLIVKLSVRLAVCEMRAYPVIDFNGTRSGGVFLCRYIDFCMPWRGGWR